MFLYWYLLQARMFLISTSGVLTLAQHLRAFKWLARGKSKITGQKVCSGRKMDGLVKQYWQASSAVGSGLPHKLIAFGLVIACSQGCASECEEYRSRAQSRGSRAFRGAVSQNDEGFGWNN